ncbi:MAG: glycosyltransferase family 4 protein [Bryobacteraceae bacterium]
MTILAVHNRYALRGGEDRVFEAECALLEARGHRVIRYLEDNRRIAQMSKARLLGLTLWNAGAYRELRGLIQRERPSLAHLHNTFPLLCSAALRAVRDAGIPVVETLHNFRPVCPNGLLLRSGRPCQDCIGRAFPWPGVRHGCYRGSRAATLWAALVLARRKQGGAWHDGVDGFIAVSRFAREILLKAGAPGHKLMVKPNFVHPDPGPGDGSGGYAMYVGRLSQEKGVLVLVEAWKTMGARTKLLVAGEGPLASRLREASPGGIELLGARPRAELMELLRGASLLVMPSLCYEGCPLAVLEAFAAGTPVVASDLGGLAELITPGRTGWLAPPGDANALAATLDGALSDPVARARMRQWARQEYEARYTAEVNYRRLMEIYRQVARD